jgi:hypothetical protein
MTVLAFTHHNEHPLPMSVELLEHQPPAEFSGGAPTRRSRVLVAACVVAVVVVGSLWWFRGGSRLSAAGGGYGVPVPAGVDASIGIMAFADSSGDVRLDSVSATLSAGATVTWSIYQGSPTQGFGTWQGPLAPRWPTLPVAGFHDVSVGDPSVEGSTWIVGTISAATPGVYRLSDVEITYHSGWRTRTVSAHTYACVLVYPPSTTYEHLVAAADPTITPYDECVNGGK